MNRLGGRSGPTPARRSVDFLTPPHDDDLVTQAFEPVPRRDGAVAHHRSFFMNRSSRYAWVVGFGLALVVGASAREAFAIKQFLDEFKAVYVKEGTPLAAAVEKAKCNVCHVGKSKKDRNAYGDALAERLDKKEDAKNVEKIRKALDEVAALSSDPSKADAPTFGALIEEGKLPGGNAE